jgi:hypothetical protein
MAAVRCAVDRRDGRADAAFASALAIDPTYARAWVARAKCDLTRGNEARALAAVSRARDLGEPGAGDAGPGLVRTFDAVADAAERDALVVRAVTAEDPAVAWSAICAWGEEHGDATLWAQGALGLARVAPSGRDEAARVAQRLAGLGFQGLARLIAASVVATADDSPLSCAGCELAQRLAVDDAMARGPLASAWRAGVRARVGLEEIAARALLNGDAAGSRATAELVARANPNAPGARRLLGVSEGALAARPSADSPPSVISAATWVALGLVVDTGDAGRVLGRLPHDAWIPGDDGVVRGAVALALRGVVPLGALPPEAQVEVRALQNESLGEGGSWPMPAGLDARHQALAQALGAQLAPEARGDREWHLARMNAADRVVAVARSVQALRAASPVDPAAPRTLLAVDPADPLVAATALRLAERVGDAEVERRARAAIRRFARDSATVRGLPVTE